MAENEDKFNKIINELGKGKVNFGSEKDDQVFISVDNHFEYNGKMYLVEVDSGNEAKIIVGEYVLINLIFEECKEEDVKKFEQKDCIFLVIHYYKDYNAERTKKNLKLVKEYLNSEICYEALSSEEFNSKEELLDLL